jgi:hypothetical protein
MVTRLGSFFDFSSVLRTFSLGSFLILGSFFDFSSVRRTNTTKRQQTSATGDEEMWASQQKDTGSLTETTYQQQHTFPCESKTITS